jgi:hypothetical protein
VFAIEAMLGQRAGALESMALHRMAVRFYTGGRLQEEIVRRGSLQTSDRTGKATGKQPPG